MLCLKRRKGERIHIGRRIVIEVLRVQGDTVQIGIRTPEGTLVGGAEGGRHPPPLRPPEDPPTPDNGPPATTL